MQIVATKVFEGQIRSHGDYMYEYLIETDCDEEEILNFVKFVLNKKHLPEEKEWYKNTQSDEYGMDYYARGYYTLDRCESGWKYIIHEPYMD